MILSKTTFLQPICHKLEKRRPDFYKITEMQSVSILSHPSILPSLSVWCISYVV